MNEILSITSGVLLALSGFVYVLSMLFGKTEPTRGTWIMWATLDAALFAGMYVADTLNGQIIASVGNSFFIMLFAILGWGKKGWTRLEVSCLAILPFGLLLWWITSNESSNIAIALTLISVACWPTYESMRTNPKRESRISWMLVFMSSLVLLPTLPPIEEWTIKAVAQPIVFFLTLIPMMYLLWIRPYIK